MDIVNFIGKICLIIPLLTLAIFWYLYLLFVFRDGKYDPLGTEFYPMRRLWKIKIKLALTLYSLPKRVYKFCKRTIKRQWYIVTGRKALMKKTVIKLNLRKREMETELKIWVQPEIEEFFRSASLEKGNPSRDDDNNSRPGNTSTSSKWKNVEGKGLEYYVKNVKLSNKIDGMENVIDNFGNGLLHRGQLNLALLRLKGISDGDGITIRTSDLLGYEEMNQYTQELAAWTKAFYEEYLHDQELEATITLDI